MSVRVGFLLDNPTLHWIWLFDFDCFFKLPSDYYIVKSENLKIFRDKGKKDKDKKKKKRKFL